MKELAKRAQNLAPSKNAATKTWPFWDLIQHHSRCMLRHVATGWPNASNTLCATISQDVACVCPRIWNVSNKDFLSSVYSWKNLNRKLNHLIKLFAKPACSKIFTSVINIISNQEGGQDCWILAKFFFAWYFLNFFLASVPPQVKFVVDIILYLFLFPCSCFFPVE